MAGTITLDFLIIISVLIANYPFLTGKQMLFAVDILHEQYPWQMTINRLLENAPSEIPTWNPYSFCGCPLAADPQMQLFYPLALLFRFLPFPLALGWFNTLHMSISAIGTACFLRIQKCSLPAQYFGAVSFSFGLHQWMLASCSTAYASFSWIPLIAYACFICINKPFSGNLILLVVFLTWQMLAGHPQYLIITFWLVFALFVFSSSAPKYAALQIAPAYLLASLLAAVILVPAITYVLFYSSRDASLDIVMRSVNDFEYSHLWGYLLPFSICPAIEKTLCAKHMWAISHFCGSLALLFAITRATLIKGPSIKLPIILVISGLILGLGYNAPVVGEAIKTIPPFTHMRHSALWLSLSDFGIAWLAALGVDALFSRNAGNRKAIIIAWTIPGFTILLCFIITRIGSETLIKAGVPANVVLFELARFKYGIIPAILFGFAILLFFVSHKRPSIIKAVKYTVALIASGELILTGFHYQSRAYSSHLMSCSKEEIFLLSETIHKPGLMRSLAWPVTSPSGYRKNRVSTGKSREEALSNIRGGLQPNVATLIGMKDVDGDNPLVPKKFSRMLKTLSECDSPRTRAAKTILDKLGVHYMFTHERIEGMGEPVFDGFSKIYKLESGFPQLAKVRSGRFRNFEIENERADVWKIKNNQKGRNVHLIIRENYLPGWKAYPRELATVRPSPDNLIQVSIRSAMRCIFIIYDPLSVKVGLYLSIITTASLLTCILLMIHARNKPFFIYCEPSAKHKYN